MITSKETSSLISWESQTFVPHIAIVGLGYVGLPLLAEFGRTAWAPVSGFDVSESRVTSLKEGVDQNHDLEVGALDQVKATYSTDAAIIADSNFIIVAVPTPIGKANQPDLSLIESASRTVGSHLKAGSIVVYESTVYPGVTEETCVPILEEVSGLTCGVDFKVGYSPERVNPGDREHTIEKIVKIVSGMDQETLEIVANVYSAVCKGGVHKAPTIKTAEAAKVIENVQRDLNISLMNELSVIFHLMGVDTHDVIDAAATKWNFHKYSPGLVGGHCIGVDPYYLTFKAQEYGYNPEVILAGRRINDSMGARVASHTLSGLVSAGKVVQGARVLVMGLTFKPDIRDTRNSKIGDTISKLQEYGVTISGYDPNLSEEEVRSFGVEPIADISEVNGVDAVIVATAHRQFDDISITDIAALCNRNGDGRKVLIDVKGLYRKSVSDVDDLIYTCL
jgi:UDP-N-acetyl-D-glucosamine/UDP-N-acetyl-D-galactosamine dehydrogenase